MFILKSFPIFISIIGLALLVSGMALAIELPTPSTLMSDFSLKSQNISVIEPHESNQDHVVIVSYQTFAIADLLTKWFGDSWESSDTEVVFLAQDGYRSVVSGEKLSKYRAFLAFARTDGLPFIIDNIGQNQNKVPLGPYYLIWENRGKQELLSQGAYGWPYQIKAIELFETSENQLLLPQKLTRNLEQGLSNTKTYCLTCHHIRGIGGKKYPVDLLQASCKWTDTDLKALIESPSRFIPNSTMPSLGRMLSAKERQINIERIVSYLSVMQTEQQPSCAYKTIPNKSVEPISKGLKN